MASFNKVIAMGNLGADPEIRQAGDAQVATFRIACSERWKDKNTGEQREATEWITCVAWRGLAGIAQSYLRKGSPVLIEGKLKTRSWEDSSTGQKRYATEVLVEDLKLLGSRQEGQGSPGGSSGGSQQGGNRDYSGSGPGSMAPPDDLPF
jgi:single-strand DNA-binding protein